MFLKVIVYFFFLFCLEKYYFFCFNEVFVDFVFLVIVWEEVVLVVKFVVVELERLFGFFLVLNKFCLEVIDYVNWFLGWDYFKEIKVGMYVYLSMDYLYVYIISKDMYLFKVKYKKYYNSFNIEFFIFLVDYLLVDDDVRRDVGF